MHSSLNLVTAAIFSNCFKSSGFRPGQSGIFAGRRRSFRAPVFNQFVALFVHMQFAFRAPVALPSESPNAIIAESAYCRLKNKWGDHLFLIKHLVLIRYQKNKYLIESLGMKSMSVHAISFFPSSSTFSINVRIFAVTCSTGRKRNIRED